MTTNILNYDGTPLTTVADNVLDTVSASIVFAGRGYVNYGAPIQQDLLWIMQNFARATAPDNPKAGQTWFDTGNNKLKVYDGASWLETGGVQQGAVAPANPILGTLWFDTINNQLKVWNTITWLLVGPLGSSANTDPQDPLVPSNSVIDAIRITDTTDVVHQAWRITIGGTLFAIFSKDATYSPKAPGISGFSQIQTGITFNSDIANVSVGTGPNLGLFFKNNSNNEPIANNTYDFGSVANKFANVYSTNFIGVASSAKYADLAERYEADESYMAGTIVALGGTHEITATRERGTQDVFGVVSHFPAYLMNSEVGCNETHPPVALVGRIPARVEGTVRKGQRLMASATPGVACAWSTTYGPLAIIGRSLQDKTTEQEQLIEIVVGKQ